VEGEKSEAALRGEKRELAEVEICGEEHGQGRDEGTRATDAEQNIRDG
jgi:hypothetical protein